MPHRWCDSAKIRRWHIESGLDLTFNEVFKPLFIERISALKPVHLLEIGAGTGHLSKELSLLGFKVTAIEPSSGMYAVATDVLLNSQVKLIKCTSSNLEMSAIFDVAFSHLVAHVVDDLFEFFSSIVKHLNIGGHFIFSIPHPCFYNDYKKFFGSEYNYMQPIDKDVSFSITKDKINTICDVPYHHWPLSTYINTLVKSGFAIDGFDETYPSDEVQKLYGPRWETPRYCVFICKKL